jgi:hypothetical protein
VARSTRAPGDAGLHAGPERLADLAVGESFLHPEVLEDRGASLLRMGLRKRAGRTTGLSIHLAVFALGAMTFVLIGLLKADPAEWAGVSKTAWHS